MAATRQPLPIDEMEERLELVTKYQEHLWAKSNAKSDEERRNRGLTAFELSVLMAWPLEKLRQTDVIELTSFMVHEELVRICKLCLFLVDKIIVH